MSPLFSIMTPTWNRIEYEKRAIESVRNQSFQDWEMLISDASDGHELEDWLEGLDDNRIRYFRTVNRSPHTRRQELFNMSWGQLSCFLDSDDYWEPSRLSEYVRIFERYPWVGLAWDEFKDVGEDQHIKQPFPPGLVEAPRLGRHLLAHDNFVHMSSLTARKKAILLTGGYPDSWLGDWLMAIRIGILYPTFYLGKQLSYRDLSAPKRISYGGDPFMTREYRRVQWDYLCKRPQTSLFPLVKYFFTHGRKRRVFKRYFDTPDLLWILKNRVLKLRRRYLWLRGTAWSDGFKWNVRGLNDSYLSYAPHEEWLRPEILVRGGLFVDVGAHVGRWSLRASKYYDNVAAFEPTTRTREVLNKNLALNGIHNVTVFSTALGEGAGMKTMHYFPILHSNGGNSLLSANPAQVAKYNRKVVNLENVSVQTLDSYGFSPSLIKVDTEGYEIPVLKGAVNTLKRTGKVVVEVHNLDHEKEIARLLTDARFRVRMVRQMFEQHLIGERV